MSLILITLGGVFLLGLLADIIASVTPFPRVTVLLISGFAIGPSALNWLPQLPDVVFPLLTTIALSMIGFLMGGRLTTKSIHKLGWPVLSISIWLTLATALLVFIAMLLLGVPPVVALVIAGVAPATDPAATLDVVANLKSKGPVTDSLIGIVAIDDVWGIILFNILIIIALAYTSNGTIDITDIVIAGGQELIFGIAVGAILGVPIAFLTGRIGKGEPIQAEAIGAVLLVAGLAERFSFSPILSSMAMGCVVTNLAQHHRRPFHAIEGIEWPFLILFFLLAGASLDATAILMVWPILLGYITARIVGRIVGVGIGRRFTSSDTRHLRGMGMALLPQAGVALGLTLFALELIPESEALVLPLILSATIIFEIFGPIFTRRYLERSGEVGADNKKRGS